MSKNSLNNLTANQLTIIVSSTMIGVGVLNLAGGVVKYANQDGWIAIIIGSVYPFYIVLCASYIQKKFPKENVLVLNKRYFGNILGTLVNIIFFTFFAFYASAIASGFCNLFRVYVVCFLTPLKVLSIILLLCAYGAVKNIQIIGRINQIIFFGTIALFFYTL